MKSEEKTNILEKLVKRGKLPVLFIGSGISRRYLYNYPNWKELLKSTFDYIEPDGFLYERYYDEIQREELTPFQINAKLGSIAETEFNKAFFEKRIKLRIGNAKNPLWLQKNISPFKMYLANKFKKMTLYNNKTRSLELEMFRALKNKVSAVITTNYDLFLEKEVFDQNFSVFVNQSELFSPDSYNIAEIYKIHGSANDANSIIITERDYTNFEETRKLIIAKMLTLFTESPIIFLGYSFTDEDVQRTISDFINCLTDQQKEKIGSHFIFISHKKGEKNLVECNTNIMTSEGDYIPLTEIKTDNFGLVFEILNKLVPGISPLKIRQAKKVIKRIVNDSLISSDPESIIVGLEKLDNMDFSSKPLAIAVGYRDNILNEYGYNLITYDQIFEDVLFDNKKFDPKYMCTGRLNNIAINHLVPVFKYIKQLKAENVSIPEMPGLARYVEKHNSIDLIMSNTITKQLKKIPVIDDLQDLEAEMKKAEKTNDKAGLLLKNIHNYTLAEIRSILQKLFNDNKEAVMKSTHFKRCVMYLDYKENYE